MCTISSTIGKTFLTRQDLTRLPSQTTSSRWQVAIALSRVQQFSHLCVACPYQISVNSIFKHIHTTSINTIIWQFVPFIYHPLRERVLSHVQPTLLLYQCCFASSGSTAFFMSPSSEVIVSHLFIRVLTTPNFWCLWWWDAKFIY